MSQAVNNNTRGAEHPVYRSKGKTACIRGSIAAAVLTVAAIGALIGAYYLSPTAHAWMQTHIITQQLTAGQALYMVAAPVAGLMTLLGIGLYARANRKKTGSALPKVSCSGALKVAGVVTLAVMLGIGAYLAYHFCPHIQTAIHNGLSQKWTIGQSCLHVGLPVALVGLLVISGVALNRHLSKRRYCAV